MILLCQGYYTDQWTYPDSKDPQIAVDKTSKGDAPTTSEWSTILLSTKVRLILETLR